MITWRQMVRSYMLSSHETFKALCKKKKVPGEVHFKWEAGSRCWLVKIKPPGQDKWGPSQWIGNNKTEVAFNIGDGWLN